MVLGMILTSFSSFAAPPSAPVSQEKPEAPVTQPLMDEDLRGPVKLEPDPEPQVVDSEPANRVLSGLAQTGGAMVGGLVTGFLGFRIGCGGPRDSGDLITCNYPVLAISYGLGTVISAWAVGEWIGWDGSLLATIGGAAIAAILTAVVVENVPNSIDGESGLVGVLFVIPASAALGYQLSANWPTATGVAAMPRVTSFPIVSFDF